MFVWFRIRWHHLLAQVHSGVTFVQTEPDEDWRPPAAVCISTEHEWRLAGRAFKEQVGSHPLCVIPAEPNLACRRRAAVWHDR